MKEGVTAVTGKLGGMKKEKKLCEGWRTCWGLNCEDSTDLWSDILLPQENDLFNRSEVG